MKKYILLFSLNISFLFCVYNVGQTVSLSDQQLSREVCHESQFSNEYTVCNEQTGVGCENSTFSLYDLNGDYNGGTYHVMFFDLSATW
tara:strand:+ start:2874 stop:3137 length:264 start_codon:yes stop_codon:yes gene_type:complete